MIRNNRKALYSAAALCAIVAVDLLPAQSAHATLTIVPTFASNILTDPNSAQIQAGINAAIQRVENDINNPITVRITFQEGGGLGGSSTQIVSSTYSAYRTALLNNQVLSANDTSAIAASVPLQTNNPVNGNSGVFITRALARALGFVGASGTADSTITLNTSIMNLSRSGAQNSSFYDLQAVAAHEMDECLNVGGPGTDLPTTTGAVGAEDLFRYGSPGVRSFTTSAGAAAYFSVDGGTTNIINFNQSGGGADYADWASSSIHHVQDAFGSPNTQLDIGLPELTALDVVGWNLPEPASLSVVAFAGLGLLDRQRRAK